MSSVYRASFLTRGTQFISSGKESMFTNWSHFPSFVVIYVLTCVLYLDADGLVKLWMVKTNECIATYDQHEDKVLNEYLSQTVTDWYYRLRKIILDVNF